MAIRIQLRRDTAQNWAERNPLLAAGEIGIEIDTGKIKIGTGYPTDRWNNLSYFSGTLPEELPAAGNESELQFNKNGKLSASEKFKVDDENSTLLIEGDTNITGEYKINGEPHSHSLNSLTDTQIENPDNDEVLTYDNGIWKNKVISIPENNPGGENRSIQYKNEDKFEGASNVFHIVEDKKTLIGSLEEKDILGNKTKTTLEVKDLISVSNLPQGILNKVAYMIGSKGINIEEIPNYLIDRDTTFIPINNIFGQWRDLCFSSNSNGIGYAIGILGQSQLPKMYFLIPLNNSIEDKYLAYNISSLPQENYFSCYCNVTGSVLYLCYIKNNKYIIAKYDALKNLFTDNLLFLTYVNYIIPNIICSFDGQIVYVTYDNKIYVSYDFGGSFSEPITIQNNSTIPYVKNIKIACSSNGKIVYAAGLGSDILYKSIDYGKTFTQIELPSKPYDNRYIVSMCCSDNGEVIYIGTIEANNSIKKAYVYTKNHFYTDTWGVYFSRDLGENFYSFNIYCDFSGRNSAFLTENITADNSVLFYNNNFGMPDFWKELEANVDPIFGSKKSFFVTKDFNSMFILPFTTDYDKPIKVYKTGKLIFNDLVISSTNLILGNKDTKLSFFGNYGNTMQNITLYQDKTAGETYGQNEQQMLQEVYNFVKDLAGKLITYGLFKEPEE